MSTIAASLSPFDIGAFRNAVSGFDLKTKNAFLEVTLQLRIRGSLPLDHSFLARVGEVSKRFWERKVWPLLCDLFEERDGRLYHPGIERAPHVMPRLVSPALSEVRRAAVNSRLDRQPPGADGLQRPVTNGLQNGLQNSTNDLQTAYKTSTKFVAESTPFVAGFVAGARAPSLSPEDSSVSESLESQRDSEGERVARGEAGSTNPATNRVTKPADAGRTRIADSWRPSATDEQFARDLKLELPTTADNFRDHYLANGETRLDWSAAFRKWCRIQLNLNEQRRQGHMAMPIAGGAEEAVAATPAEADEPLPTGSSREAQWARVQRGVRNEIGRVTYRNWMAGLTLGGIDDGTLTLTLPTAFLRDHVRKHYGDRLYAWWRTEDRAIRGLVFEVATAAPHAANG